MLWLFSNENFHCSLYWWDDYFIITILKSISRFVVNTSYNSHFSLITCLLFIEMAQKIERKALTFLQSPLMDDVKWFISHFPSFIIITIIIHSSVQSGALSCWLGCRSPFLLGVRNWCVNLKCNRNMFKGLKSLVNDVFNQKPCNQWSAYDQNSNRIHKKMVPSANGQIWLVGAEKDYEKCWNSFSFFLFWGMVKQPMNCKFPADWSSSVSFKKNVQYDGIEHG